MKLPWKKKRAREAPVPGPSQDASMANIDQNATQRAQTTQAAKDVDDTAAGAPAEQGGES